MAFDTGGADAVRDWIRPPEPIVIPPPLQDIMGWTAEDCARAATPTYPCLIDTQHIVADLYQMSNVPMAVWIDERGRIVRPAEPAGASDGFRFMDRTTYAMPAEIAASGKVARKRYVDAIRDWVTHGDASPYALSDDELHERVVGPSPADAAAAANFTMGHYLRARGDNNTAARYFDEARRLCPESWHYLRQALDLQEPGKGSGPKFYAAVDALGARPYYPSVNL